MSTLHTANALAAQKLSIAAVDPTVRIPVSQVLASELSVHAALRDPSIQSSRANIVDLGSGPTDVSKDVVLTAEMLVCRNGGSLRRFDGAQAHETGWFPSFKRGRLQHWEGLTQLHTLQKAECDWNVLWAQSEARRFRFMIDGRWREYTCDVEMHLVDGTIQIIENKADERSLRDPDYRLTLAGVSEICRRIGYEFKVVMGDEVFENRHHRRNVETFASRRFTKVAPRHIRVLEAEALNNGPETTYGRLASLMEPKSASAGRAVVQALTVRRRVNIDLTDHVYDHTPVTLA